MGIVLCGLDDGCACLDGTASQRLDKSVIASYGVSTSDAELLKGSWLPSSAKAPAVEPKPLPARVSCVLEGTGALDQGSGDSCLLEEEIQDAGESDLAEVQVRVPRASVLQRASVCSVQAELKIHPDFSGVWKMIGTSGDFDGFLKESGVGWALRLAASAAGFGVNRTFHTIEQGESRIRIETKNPRGMFLKSFAIDASEQDDLCPLTKAPIKVVPYWQWMEGERVATLIFEAFKPELKGDPVQLPLSRRWMLGESMIMEQVSPKGIAVQRIFAKQ